MAYLQMDTRAGLHLCVAGDGTTSHRGPGGRDRFLLAGQMKFRSDSSPPDLYIHKPKLMRLKDPGFVNLSVRFDTGKRKVSCGWSHPDPVDFDERC